MLARIRSRLTYANVTATLALFIAIGGGTAFAVVAANQVNSASIIDGEVKNPDLGVASVTGANVAADSLNSLDIATNGIGAAEIASAAVGSAEIGTDGVGAGEIATSAVGQSEIGTAGAGPDEIATSAVKAAELNTTVVRRTEDTSVGPGETVHLVAMCQAGEQALAGGFHNGSNADLRVVTAGPVTSSSGTIPAAGASFSGWNLRAKNTTAFSTLTARVFVVCLLG